MTFAQFQYAFAHTLPLAEQRVAYDQQIVPESRRLQRGALSSLARVDFKRPRAPLLIIAGEPDHIIPASLNRANARRYKSSPSVTDFKEFPGRTHYITYVNHRMAIAPANRAEHERGLLDSLTPDRGHRQERASQRAHC